MTVITDEGCFSMDYCDSRTARVTLAGVDTATGKISGTKHPGGQPIETINLKKGFLIIIF